MFIVVCTSVLAGACSAASEPPDKTITTPTPGTNIETIDSQIAELTKNNYCETALDCAFMPLGERACGGPSGYKIYSKQIGDEAVNKLHELSAESVALAKKANQQSGLLSSCDIYPLPSVSCIENQCVKN